MINNLSPVFTAERSPNNGKLNKLSIEDKPVHDWYRFVLSFPPHLVREYIDKFNLNSSHLVLDPFCGTGTTNVECQKLGIPNVGLEANPFASFAAEVKTDWQIDYDELLACSYKVAEEAIAQLERENIIDNPILQDYQSFKKILESNTLRTLNPELEKLLLTNSLSPIPLHKVLVLLDVLNHHSNGKYYKHQMLAFAKALTFSISNLSFGPEVGIGQIKIDTPVIEAWLEKIHQMANDLRDLPYQRATLSTIHCADARNILQVIKPNTIDAVITSPPYPNEKDYTRTTRLEMVMLGFIKNKAELQTVKQNLLRSNTRGVYKGDTDDIWVKDFPEILAIAEAIEARRIALDKTSGFERLYARVTKLYFGGIARHLADLRRLLRPGAQLAYVVGDQASYLRVMIHTGKHLANIAQSLGYEVVGTDLFRTRLATATKEQLREEVILLRWPKS